MLAECAGKYVLASIHPQFRVAFVHKLGILNIQWTFLRKDKMKLKLHIEDDNIEENVRTINQI